jgi:hypothetical protein
MEGAGVIDAANVYSLVKSLAIVYSVAAVGFAITRFALSRRSGKETYVISDARGHKVYVTLDPAAPADERARVMSAKINELAMQDR